MYLLKTIKRNNFVKSISENSIFASTTNYKALLFKTKEEAVEIIKKYNHEKRVVAVKAN